jgi:hypothetical protein
MIFTLGGRQMNTGKVATVKAIKTYGEVEIQLHSFVASEIMVWEVSFRPRQLYSRRNINQYPVIRKLLAPQNSLNPPKRQILLHCPGSIPVTSSL